MAATPIFDAWMAKAIEATKSAAPQDTITIPCNFLRIDMFRYASISADLRPSRIMNDPGLGTQLAAAARHRAEQHHQPHAALDAVEAIYRSLLDAEAARSEPS